MKPVILVGFRPGILTHEEVAALEAAAPEHRLVVSEDPAVHEGLLEDLEIAAGPVRPSLFLRAPRFRWYQGWGAGADWLRRYPEATERGVIVTNTSGIHRVQMTEHIFALLLSFARQLPMALDGQRQSRWVHAENDQVFELAGKTLLLVGLGPIGRYTAKVAGAFGMRVWAIRRRGSEPVEGVERVGLAPDLLEFLSQADVVVLVVPLTSETQHIINAAALERMKSTAYLINVGRGGLVDEVALVAALSGGRIAGAGLDVFEKEPLADDSPLWKLPNVILTGHYAGVTPDYDRRATAIFLDNLKRYVAGEPLRDVIDKRLGY